MASTPSQRTYAATIAALETDEQSAWRIADLFTEGFSAEEVAVSLVDARRGNWRVTCYFRGAVDEGRVRSLAAAAVGIAAPSLRFEHIAAKNWVRESLVGLKPVAAGRFVVHGAHDRGSVARNRIGIEIEAALAFGTGHHGTTRGCLLALDRICKALGNRPLMQPSPSPGKGEGRGGGHDARHRSIATPTRFAGARRPPPFRGRTSLRMLDLGTGSGVLAIAAARALRRRVLASDIDAAAVRVARDNARLNRVGPLLEIANASGVTAPAIRARAPFDLVFANILLEPLQRLASPLAKIIAPGGQVVLSGLLTSQANAALAAYRGLALERRIVLDGWTTLVLQRRIGPRRAVAGRCRAS
jgi:ribosomal protein L11 methyltransferase